MREVALDEAEPAQGQLDGSVPTQAQEGAAGGDDEEADAPHHQVPAGDRRRQSERHPRQAQPEAGSAEGAARTGDPVSRSS